MESHRGPLPVPPAPLLSAGEKDFLRVLVREALQCELAGNPAPEREIPEGILTQSVGVFVSLYRGDVLRGCIGRFEGETPLWEATREMTLAAALRDPRFPPVESSELPELTFEISLLGPLVSVPPEERDAQGTFLEVGTHGVSVRLGDLSGILLPQVAPKQGWDSLRLLREVCLKARLDAEAWRDLATTLKLFQGSRFVGGPED